MKKNSKYVVYPIAAVVAVVVVLVIFLKGNDADQEIKWQTTTVHRGDVSYKVTASGTLSPLVTVDVGSQVSGRLQEIFVDFNSEVKKGQLIAVVDPSLIEFDVLKARAAVKTARANIARAEASVFDKKQIDERTRLLLGKKLASEMDADSAKAALKSAQAELLSARAQYTQAQAALKQAEANLGYTKIVSPIDGVVISRQIDVGQTVAASFQAPVLFQIAGDLRRMEVHTSLAESDVGQVKDGMPVEFTVDAFPTRTFKGKVKQVRYSPTTEQNVVTYDAVVSVDNDELLLRPGMTADVRFIVSESKNALILSNTALRFKPPAVDGDDSGSKRKKPAGNPFGMMRPRPRQEASRSDESEFAKIKGGMKTVWRVGADGQLESVEIKAGITDGRTTEILDGLAENDQIVTGIEQEGGTKGKMR